MSEDTEKRRLVANPFSPQTSPAAYENWEREQAALDVTEAEARRQLQSARFEDAGLHPQGYAAQGVQVQTTTGDSGTQRAAAEKAPRNEYGETAAEQYRRELSGQPPQTDRTAQQTDDRIRPSGTFSQNVSGNPDQQNVTITTTTPPVVNPDPTQPPDPHGSLSQPQTQPAGDEQAEPAATPDNPLPPPFTPPVEPTDAPVTHPEGLPSDPAPDAG